MTTTNSKTLLDREKIDLFMKDNMSPSIALLRELVDYGVELLDKNSQKGGSISDLVILGHFFKHAITMLDGTEIQLSKGAVVAACVTARSMLEAYIYIAWLLQKDTDRRGRQFYVWHLRQKREWARRTIPGAPENIRFQAQLNSLSSMQDAIQRATLEADAIKQDEEYTAMLTNNRNKTINDGFDKFKTRYFDVAWYRPSGPESIGKMAKELGLESEYTFFYSQFSNITHVGSFDKSVTIDATCKGVTFEPIRSPAYIHTIISIVATLAFRIYLIIIARYSPNERQSFNQSYVNQWRNRFRSIPEVIIKESPQERDGLYR